MGLKTWLEARRMLKALDRLATSLEAQTILLQRLVDHLAPIVPEASQRDLLPIGWVFTRDSEQVRILDFIDRTRQRIGRDPSEDELAHFLDGEPA